MKKINVNTRQQLNSLLSERLVVQKVSGSFVKKKGLIRVLYGETYDKYGITIDSLKYYLFLEYLARVIEGGAECVVVEGDLHSVINPLVNEKDILLREGELRVRKINNIFKVLGIKHVAVRLMSDLFAEAKIANMVNQTAELVKGSSDLQNQLAPTVLQNRIAQERQSGFRYAAEAIGLALCFDLKIGPPREVNYDKVAQIIGHGVDRKYDSIYLRPSFPFTPDFSYYLTHPEIEEYGLTPYKGGSNKLVDLRIVLGKTTDQELRDLITSAYVPTDMIYANPLVDLALIVEMATQIKMNKINPTDLGTQIRLLVGNRERLIEEILQLTREVV